MQRILLAVLFALTGCGPANVTVEPGAVVIQASPFQQQADPAPTPSASPSPSPCPDRWTHVTSGANFCMNTARQSPVATTTTAQATCAAMSAKICSVTDLAAYCPDSGEYLWTAQATASGTPVLFYEYNAGQHFSVVQGPTGGSDPAIPAANPFFCCSDPRPN